VRVRRVEEELLAGTREREVGAVRVRKRVVTEHRRMEVPIRREEVVVERVPVEGEVAAEAQIGEEEEEEEEEVVVVVVAVFGDRTSGRSARAFLRPALGQRKGRGEEPRPLAALLVGESTNHYEEAFFAQSGS